MKKFTLFIMMLVMCATTTFAQTAITSAEDVKPGKLYWFRSLFMYSQGYEGYGYSSTLVYPDSEGYNDMIWASGTWVGANDHTDPNQQFAFVEYDGQLYLYSVGADKFVSWNNDGAHLMDIPEYYVTIKQSTAGYEEFPWCMAFNDTKLIGVYWYTNYAYSGYLYCSGENTGSVVYGWQIYEAGDLENADELTARLAAALSEGKKLQEEAADNLMYTFEEAEDLLSDINYMYNEGTEIELQVTDPDAPNYIWCNEPEQSEGPIEGLIDDEKNTFFHSCWNGTMEPEHWLQVDLGVALKDFQFNYHTRVGAKSCFPSTIEVMGSNDGDYFETITTFNSGLPNAADKSWESGNINADQEYKHLRFVIASEKVYFHLAEFNLLTETTITVEDLDYEPYLKYLVELEKVVKEAKEFWENNPEATVDEYNAYTEKVRKALNLVKNLVSGAHDDETKEYIKVVEAVLAKEGVGFPGEAPRAALKAVLDAAKANPTTQARFDLEEALAKYYESEDITLPADGTQYSIAFVTTKNERNYLTYSVESAEESGNDYDIYRLHLTRLTEDQEIPESAAFTCINNGDGTFDFTCAQGKYLTVPGWGVDSGTEEGIADFPTYFQVVRMFPTPGSYYTENATYEQMFGFATLCKGGTYMVSNRDGSCFYSDPAPNFVQAWTSALEFKPWSPVTESIDAVIVENSIKGIYDLSGRKVENPTKGIYIIDGKKTVIK